MHMRYMLVAGAVLLSACQSLDKAIKTADSAVNAVNTGTMKNIAQIASSQDPSTALKQEAKDRAEYYKRHPRAVLDDIKAVKHDFDKLMNFLQGNVSKTWGGKEVKVPTKTQYVKYTQNYMSRAVVDFDNGEVMVETLDEHDPKGSLVNAIVTTLLTPDDPRSVDLFSDKGITLTGDKDPYLKGLVVDKNGHNVDTPASAEAFAKTLADTEAKRRNVDVNGTNKNALYVKIPMVSNFNNKQAQKYSAVVNKYATKHNISPSLVYAVIRTESNFNPYAVSAVPAYGLMQLVPTSGGRDAYRKVTGSDGIPSKEYLFDSSNNIELGTAYLNILAYNQLEAVSSAVSREYCMISAYNTGTGNVLKVFSSNRTEAINTINRSEPSKVYKKLRAELPYQETRDYLKKVVDYRKEFVNAN
jgi:membrane-bound lytic murein transglycosylase C